MRKEKEVIKLSVPTWRRSLSRVEFLFQAYQLEIKVAQLVYKAPSKYRNTFGDMMIKDCTEAIKHGRCANDIYVTDKTTLDQRLYELSQMKACIDNVGTNAYVWMELIRKHDGIDSKLSEKYYDKENEIGEACDNIIALIDGVKKSDKRLFADRHNKEGGNGA